MDEKWICIMCAVIAVALFGGLALSEHAKYGAIAECYKAGKENCDKLR